MKKNERLADLIGKCDDKFIDLCNTETTPVAKRHISLVPFAAAAACICLIGGTAYIYSQKSDTDNATSQSASGVYSQSSFDASTELETSETIDFSQTETIEKSENDIAEIPKWDEMALYEQFPAATLGGTEFTVSQNIVSLPQTYVGKKLGTLQCQSTDVYTDNTYCDDFEYYEINNVDSDYAVALYFDEISEYHVYTNSSYDTPTFGDLINGLNLTEYMDFDTLYYTAEDEMTVLRYMLELDDADTSALWEFFAQLANAESVGDYLEFSDYVVKENSDVLDEVLDFSVSSDVLGFENLSLSVTCGGYITTNITSTGRAFYIGKDKVSELISLLSNCIDYRKN